MTGGMTTAEKNRETNARRAAARQGLQLVKSRRRDHRAVDYGRYALIDPATAGVIYGTVSGGCFIATLDAVEDYLNGEGR